MIDDVRRVATIGVVGREDRALLRSNPSVRSDAGTWAGASARRRLLSSSPCSGSEALNLGVWGRAPTPRRGESTPTGLPYGNIEGAAETSIVLSPLRGSAGMKAIDSPGLAPRATRRRLFEASHALRSKRICPPAVSLPVTGNKRNP